jgi:hypothetical protein
MYDSSLKYGLTLSDTYVNICHYMRKFCPARPLYPTGHPPHPTEKGAQDTIHDLYGPDKGSPNKWIDFYGQDEEVKPYGQTL